MLLEGPRLGSGESPTLDACVGRLKEDERWGLIVEKISMLPNQRFNLTPTCPEPVG